MFQIPVWTDRYGKIGAHHLCYLGSLERGTDRNLGNHNSESLHAYTTPCFREEPRMGRMGMIIWKCAVISSLVTEPKNVLAQ